MVTAMETKIPPRPEPPKYPESLRPEPPPTPGLMKIPAA